ncbi:hypothetical protein LOZ51_000325 [Ophidiomyces ophidiicola]|nr:hypothetical protein LOZ55_005069 [Ophidiomyces ophidiicola]KAI1985948.1 hypothetical protein LOZ54_004056 [Ophidiomyces ophidiicola]KAI2003250.1 hypothetical protein LOZ51_000325 [Ophidiomyces ophidiicola]
MSFIKIPRPVATLCSATPTRPLARSLVLASTVGGARYVHRHLANKDQTYSMKRELGRLGPDRVALLKRVQSLLDKKDIVKALELTRLAQLKGINAEASWNAVIQKEFEESTAIDALKLYNDMKKRGFKPNKYTYSIILKGIASHPLTKGVKLGMALLESIPPQMYSIIHTNAMLTVCVAHNDMTALWEIVSNLPTTGSHAADARTYSTILVAIRHEAEKAVEKLDEKSQAATILARRSDAIKDGKRIWLEVLDRWGKGQLVVDQGLVYQMGRLLLFGGLRRDYFDILALYEQTMQIKRPKSMMALIDDTTNILDKRRKWELEQEALTDENNAYKMENDGGYEATDKIFSEMKLKSAAGSEPVYPLPTDFDLHLILRACEGFRGGASIGEEYWTLLTSPQHEAHIEPSSPSLHSLLSLRKENRASAASLSLITSEIIPKGFAFGKTFHVAMGACNRDHLNPNVLNTASSLLRLLSEIGTTSSPATIISYVEVVKKCVSEKVLLAQTQTGGPLARQDIHILRKNRLLQACSCLSAAIQQLISKIQRQDRGNSTENRSKYNGARSTTSSPILEAAMTDLSNRALIRVIQIYRQLLARPTVELLSADEKQTAEVAIIRLQRFLTPSPQRYKSTSSQSNTYTALIE